MNDILQLFKAEQNTNDKLTDDDVMDYIYHPIHSFYLLERSPEWLPKLYPNHYENLLLENKTTNRLLQEASFGIVDLQEYQCHCQITK